jgi:hypothetical protein
MLHFRSRILSGLGTKALAPTPYSLCPIHHSITVT